MSTAEFESAQHGLAFTAGPAAGSGPTPSPVAVSVSVCHPQPGVVLVRLVGEIDLAAVDRCRRVLCHARREATPTASAARHAGARDAGLVVCDLTAVTFLGAAGVGVLAETDALARRDGAALRLVVATRPIRRVLALTGPDRRIPTVSRLSEALPAQPGQAA